MEKENHFNRHEGIIDIPFTIRKREQSEFDLCLYLRSCIEGLISIAVSGKQGEPMEGPGICVYELLENAIRYSILGEMIRVRAEIQEKSIIIRIINICEPQRAEQLQTIITEMNNAAPLEYYLQQMRTGSRRQNGAGGLGLARLYHDCNAKISLESESLPKDTRITVSAEIPLQ